MSDLSPTQKVKFLDRNPPTFPDEAVRRIAAELFGLEGEFKPLNSERDQNFRIQAERDKQYVLKIANFDEDPNVVDLQVQGLLHVEKIDPGMPVPRVVRAIAGEPSTWVEGPGGALHIARALTYLPGTDLGKMPLTPTLLGNLGSAVARLGKALRGFCHPAARHELLWDLQQAPHLRPHTSHIADKADRMRVERVLDDFTSLSPRTHPTRSSALWISAT
jgi:Ser/Thr protein kinase RdoA (MazF antagonist)